MGLDWDAWIGQDPEVEDNVPPTAEESVLPPPVLDNLLEESYVEDAELDKKIETFMAEDVHLPPLKTLHDYPDEIVQDPILIEGLFRKGRKGILTADSKAGKSFFAIELAICVAAGRPFLGRKCTKSKVVYFNYEIEEKE
ncbi:MAG: AAA family ATPase, partial [Clostridia bacterium]|nr:AAA family ATPase [Clostridia bacterium]